MRYLAAALAALLAVSACNDSPTSVEPREDLDLTTVSSARSGIIPGRFIVTLREGASPAAVAREHGVRPDFVYTHALNGFAGPISDVARQGLLRDTRVTRVEPDGIATIVTTETNATWGLPLCQYE